MYEDERHFIKSVRYEQLSDVVMCMTEDSEFTQTLSEHAFYDCVNLMSPESRLFITDLAEYKYSQIDFPDRFVLWSHSESKLRQILSDLKQHGYDISEIGEDHCSVVYLCELK